MPEIPDINTTLLQPLLTTTFLGRTLLSEFELASTNITAAELAAAKAPEGLVVVADHQTAGRGRNGRSWLSPPNKNLYFSILLRPDCPPAAVPQLAILTALSIAKALRLPGIAVKWPNDVWMNGHKLCGILSAMSCMGDKTEYAIIGIGINVNMREFPVEIQGTSLALETSREFRRSEVLAAVLNTIETDYLLWLREQSLSPFMERWAECSMLDGHTITAEHGHDILNGTACGITPDGHLKLKCPDGVTRLIAAGDTHILL
ncbi:MAG: biotin--[Victivallales bacterium]|nr:biotin--[acetyl-CoA-carboxylase] ligase [Victivallales bacterium]